MKNNKYLLSTILAVVVFAACAIAVVVRVCIPAAIIPPLNIPGMAALSVIALLIEHFLTKGNPRCYICIPVFGALAFGVLPLMAGFACRHDFWKYGLVGGVVFTAVTFLFTSAQDRLLTGPKAKAAALITGIGIWLAFQCFAGIIL
jgi:hypothetical protein